MLFIGGRLNRACAAERLIGFYCRSARPGSLLWLPQQTFPRVWEPGISPLLFLDDIILELAAPRICLAAWLTNSREFPIQIQTSTGGVYIIPGTVSVQNCTRHALSSRQGAAASNRLHLLKIGA